MEENKVVLRCGSGPRSDLPAPGLRTIAAHAVVDPKTARRYSQAAEAAGLERGAG